MTIIAGVARLPLVTTDLSALRQVAQRDVDAFAAFMTSPVPGYSVW